MSKTKKQSAFLKSPLVTWVLSLDDGQAAKAIDNVTTDYEDVSIISDERFLSKVWLQIEASSTFSNLSDGSSFAAASAVVEPFQANNSNNRNANSSKSSRPFAQRLECLAALMCDLQEFYADRLGQHLVLKLPDIVKIAAMKTSPSDDDLDELRRFLLLLLGSAVQCVKKQRFIEDLKSLDIKRQQDMYQCIKEICDNPAAVWPRSGWAELELSPEEEQSRFYASAVERLAALAAERDALWRQCVQLVVQLEQFKPTLLSAEHDGPSGVPEGSGNDHHRSNGMSLSCSAMSISSMTSSQYGGSTMSISTAGMSVERSSQLSAELTETHMKLKRAQRDVEDKNELVADLTERLEQSNAVKAKFQQENLELNQEARSAKPLRDEIDVLNERVRRVDRLESELQRYRDTIHERDFYKSRLEEVREDNRILCESKAVLEDQLQTSRQKVERLPELEGQVLQLKAYSEELENQRQVDKEKCGQLFEQVNQLEVDMKAAREQLSQAEAELAQLRCQLVDIGHGGQRNGHSLLDQLNNDATKRVLKLELENQKLQAMAENIKLNGAKNSGSVNSSNKRYSIDCSPGVANGVRSLEAEDDDELLIFEQSHNVHSHLDSAGPDSGVSFSLSSDLNSRLERLEKENGKLNASMARLKEAEARVNKLSSARSELEIEMKISRDRNDDKLKSLGASRGRLEQALEEYRKKFEASEMDQTKLNADKQRLQRQVDSLKKKMEEQQMDAAGLEAVNAKLQASAETVKATLARLHELEREVTTLEADNHKLVQQKRSLEKEVARAKGAVDSKDGLLYEHGSRVTALDLEVKSLKREFEDMTKQRDAARRRAERLAELEGQMSIFKEQAKELTRQRDSERDKVTQLFKEANVVRAEKMAALEEVAAVQAELDHLRCQRAAVLEQQQQQRSSNSTMDPLDTPRSRSRRPYIDPSLTSGHNHLLGDLSGASSPEAGGVSGSDTDSGCASLVGELRVTSEKLREAEHTIDNLKHVKGELEAHLCLTRERAEVETLKLEETEASASRLAAECQRLHRQVVTLSKLLDGDRSYASPHHQTLHQENNNSTNEAATRQQFENKLTINLIASSSPSNGHQGHHANGQADGSTVNGHHHHAALRSPSSPVANPAFIRGTFRSQSVNYGVMARRGVVMANNNVHHHAGQVGLPGLRMNNGPVSGQHQVPQNGQPGHVHGHYHHFHTSHHHHVHMGAVGATTSVSAVGHLMTTSGQQQHLVTSSSAGSPSLHEDSERSSPPTTHEHEDDLSEDEGNECAEHSGHHHHQNGQHHHHHLQQLEGSGDNANSVVVTGHHAPNSPTSRSETGTNSVWYEYGCV